MGARGIVTTLKNFQERILKRWSPKRYCRKALQELSEQLRSKHTLSQEETNDIELERRELYDWLREIEDEQLIDRASRIGVDLEEMDLPEERPSHYQEGTFGNRFLVYSSRLELKRLVRERGLIYRAERRETLKTVATIISALTGLGGVAVALVALLKNS